MWFVVTVALMLGVTTMLWSVVGAVRWVHPPTAPSPRRGEARLVPADVAILVAARNEELVIEATVAAACRLVQPRQVFVVSDGSSDGTAQIARSHGARVMELVTNRGKAGAIVAGLQHFAIADRFKVLMLLDADSRPADDYLETGLPLFGQPDVVAVAGRAMTSRDVRLGWVGRLLTSYRERTYVAVQTLHKFGQAMGRANAVAIVPGFASMYRTEVLHAVDIAAPGLAIEDYNMTFEIHAKRLGRVAFDPRAARAYTQDPDQVREYVKQMSRWGLGFWQTVLRHRGQARVFWVSLYLFSLEVLVSSLMLVAILPVLLVEGLRWGAVQSGWIQPDAWAFPFPVWAAVLGMLVPDLLLTVYVTVVTRRLGFVLMAPVYPLLRVVDAFVCLRALWRAARRTSTGVWSSPTRRPGSAALHGGVLGLDEGHQSDA